MGKAVSSLFGLSQGDAGALGASAEAARGAFDDASKEYTGQQQNRTSFGNQLANGALGKGPSIAEAQLNAGLDKTLAQQIAAAKSARSVNPALAFRATQRAGEDAQMQTNQAAAIARLQEQQQQQGAYQNYLNSLQNQRAQFLGLNTQANAGIASVSAQNAASQNAFTGGLVSAAASGLGSYASMANKAPSTNTLSGGGGGGGMGSVRALAHGGLVHGPEITEGDSTENDVVPAKLSSGEMVIPKTVVEQGHKAVSNFAKQLLERHKPEAKKEAKPVGYAAVLAAKSKKD